MKIEMLFTENEWKIINSSIAEILREHDMIIIVIIGDALFLATVSLVHGNVYSAKQPSSRYKIYTKQCLGFDSFVRSFLLLACSISFAPIHIGV